MCSEKDINSDYGMVLNIKPLSYRVISNNNMAN